MPRPYCFVLMPFGQKRDASGTTVDCDAVYRDVIHPAIDAAELEPIRADEEQVGGVIHKPMYERLLFCPYAVADLTTANANVFYELGVRHAVRPGRTVTLASSVTQLPFDVNHLRSLIYSLSPGGVPANPAVPRDALTARLRTAREGTTDSPLFQLVDGWRPAPLDHTKTDVFREQVDYSVEMKRRLAKARADGVHAIQAVEATLPSVEDAEAGIVVDLFLSYRAVKAWQQMVALVGRMARPVAATTMVREQLALALNRNGQGEEAEQVLRAIVDERGPSSETCGILGRVYKDRWEAAMQEDDRFLAAGALDQAIETYRRGFEADWRDAYPGVNAVTLMELKEPPDPARSQLLPVVRYAVGRRIAAGSPDYWDWATAVELGVLASDEDAAMAALRKALPLIREVWEPETTAHNIRLIREARDRRGTAESWLTTVEQQLTKRAS
jgi:hypothetical protein